ncbi:Lipopolysaccharide heptosyltransferase 1 [Actinomadura rubteroloni]|uniref:Lipopolysaccharide heptosyltransferase 1 n=1 Tax=Actinomadura rubteroloni TaxID=1926885 RepID=A0A2P4UFN8_9ACTN|nr:glycosyltransferase family 9 protein [Actinomadura rubteroloni]POM23852.1 Lipopolysaccharide heptosyltransferase 1 [Actinomadura rubteroloni]
MRRVLLLRALGLGDFLTGVPAYRAVRAAFPGHEIVLAAPAALAPLAALCDGLDRLLPTAELAPVAWDGPPPDVAIDLHGDGPASHRIVEALGAERTIVYGPEWDEHEHEIARWCRLLELNGVPADPSAFGLSPPLGAEPAVIVHPGAASGSRRWPPERFAAVVRILASAGHRVLVTGGDAERALAAEVAGGVADVLTGAGLADLAATVAAADLVVCGDTGVAHLATACGTPSVTLFGPVSPALWGPPDLPRHTVLWKGGAAGRPGDAHGADPDPRLLAITVSEVLAAAFALLDASSDIPARG